MCWSSSTIRILTGGWRRGQRSGGFPSFLIFLRLRGHGVRGARSPARPSPMRSSRFSRMSCRPTRRRGRTSRSLAIRSSIRCVPRCRPQRHGVTSASVRTMCRSCFSQAAAVRRLSASFRPCWGRQSSSVQQIPRAVSFFPLRAVWMRSASERISPPPRRR